MYAVIESGGKQYRVAVGDRLKVESLKLDPGSKLSLDKVLMVADEGGIQLGGPYLGSKVEATVIGHGRSEKVRIFKLRRRQNSRQQAGHRQNFTELEIINIAGKSSTQASKKTVKKAQAEKTPDTQSAKQVSDKGQTDKKASPKKVAKKAAGSKKTTKKATAKKKTKKKVTQKAKEKS